MSHTLTRREALRIVGAAGVGGLAGCLGWGGPDGGDETVGDGPDRSDSGTATGPGPPTSDGDLYVPHDAAALREAVVSGGPGKDGIPSVDDPTFASASAATLDGDDVVFGYAGDSTVRAYPQWVLVWHEIVNDTLDGVPVAVTYCPLTGTAMGFERGDTTFGVSGRLVNNNLVMYDRATDSRWPQMLATAVEGTHEGAHLREFRLAWTTWERWRATYPDTEVMTDDTGYVRRYGSDPYGSYLPTTGYYADGSPMFPPLHEDDRVGAKRVVVGARTADAAVAFDEPALREASVLTSGDGLVAAYDPLLDTAYVYRTPGDATVEPTGDGDVWVDGERAPPDSLPLPSVYAFDAMWHAWVGFYPGTAYVR